MDGWFAVIGVGFCGGVVFPSRSGGRNVIAVDGWFTILVCVSLSPPHPLPNAPPPACSSFEGLTKCLSARGCLFVAGGRDDDPSLFFQSLLACDGCITCFCLL